MNPNVNLKCEVLNWQNFPPYGILVTHVHGPMQKCELQNSQMYKMAQLRFSIDHNQALIKLHPLSYQYQAAISTVLKSACNPASLLKLQVQERSFSPQFYLYLFLQHHSQRPASSRPYTHCFCTINWNTAWGREELWLVDVVPDVLWEEDHEQKWLKEEKEEEEEQEDGEKEKKSMVHMYNIEKCSSTNMLDASVLVQRSTESAQTTYVTASTLICTNLWCWLDLILMHVHVHK